MRGAASTERLTPRSAGFSKILIKVQGFVQFESAGGIHMKRFLLASVIVSLSAASTLAADIAPRPYAKAPVVVQVSDWTGFYVGGAVGARVADSQWTTLDLGSFPVDPTTNGARFDNAAARVGGIVGYDWQLSPAWVVGVEGDFGWANNRSSSAGFPGVDASEFFQSQATDAVSLKLGWDASLRVRAGYLMTPSTVLYVTGGAAWHELKAGAACFGADASPSFCNSIKTVSTSVVKTGWTVGGGLETTVWRNWNARIEYRYSDFGHVTVFMPETPLVGDSLTGKVDVRTHTALVGLTYKFGDPAAAK